MGILAECPYCHTKQKTGNKTYKCGMSMDQAKKGKKVKYWISYRLPNGKQRRESADAYEDLNGYSIEDARTAFSKKRVDKKENRMFDIKQDTKMTFNELTDWCRHKR